MVAEVPGYQSFYSYLVLSTLNAQTLEDCNIITHHINSITHLGIHHGGQARTTTDLFSFRCYQDFTFPSVQQKGIVANNHIVLLSIYIAVG